MCIYVIFSHTCAKGTLVLSKGRLWSLHKIKSGKISGLAQCLVHYNHPSIWWPRSLLLTLAFRSECSCSVPSALLHFSLYPCVCVDVQSVSLCVGMYSLYPCVWGCTVCILVCVDVQSVSLHVWMYSLSMCVWMFFLYPCVWMYIMWPCVCVCVCVCVHSVAIDRCTGKIK